MRVCVRVENKIGVAEHALTARTTSNKHKHWPRQVAHASLASVDAAAGVALRSPAIAAAVPAVVTTAANRPSAAQRLSCRFNHLLSAA